MAVQAQDLHIKESISVGGNLVSSKETSIKGARERTVSQGPNGNSVTLRQCDLKRTVTLNEQAQTYLVSADPVDENAARAAALATGAVNTAASGGKITVTTTVTDTGERKVMYGYQARHLKARVVQEPSKDACTQVRQSFDIDGWYADISKEQTACAQLAPPVQQADGCHDTIISRRLGSGKPGYPLRESITMPTPDGGKTTVTVQISEIDKQELPDELFDVPDGYRQVSSIAELSGAPQVTQQAPATAPAPAPQPGAASGYNQAAVAQLMNARSPAEVQAIAQEVSGAQAGQAGFTSAGMPNLGGNQPASAPVAAPQALGPKASGKIRIGVAPPDAQLGQGNNAGADYSTPIRNVEVALMSGPAVEIAALDSHIAMQLQAEAQQKQCDYVLFSSVTVKHNSGGFGRFMKMAAPMASMAPMAGMGGGMGGAVAAQTASMAASAAAQAAQQEAMSQLTGFNGQIKSKDNVTVHYELVPTGQSAPRLQNSLQAKAKSDGEDVLTPLLQQAASAIVSEVGRK
jgi:hypothetical protein